MMNRPSVQGVSLVIVFLMMGCAVGEEIPGAASAVPEAIQTAFDGLVEAAVENVGADVNRHWTERRSDEQSDPLAVCG